MVRNYIVDTHFSPQVLRGTCIKYILIKPAKPANQRLPKALYSPVWYTVMEAISTFDLSVYCLHDLQDSCII